MTICIYIGEEVRNCELPRPNGRGLLGGIVKISETLSRKTKTQDAMLKNGIIEAVFSSLVGPGKEEEK